LNVYYDDDDEFEVVNPWLNFEFEKFSEVRMIWWYYIYVILYILLAYPMCYMYFNFFDKCVLSCEQIMITTWTKLGGVYLF